MSDERPEIPLRPIGVIRSPHRTPVGTPIQPAYAEDVVGEVVVDESFAAALGDIEGFERLWLIYRFDRAGAFEPRVVPYLDTREHGLFATRSPSRPNPIGLSVVELLGREGNVLRVRGLDVLDGTPLLDIKPYVPEFDAFPDSNAGWLDARREDRREADDRFHGRDGSAEKARRAPLPASPDDARRAGAGSALEEIAPGQIACVSYPVRYAGARFEARMTVVRLRGGGLLLHSPAPIDDALAARLAELGPVEAIIAPGNFHWFHVAASQERYPQAGTFICPGLEKKRPELRFDALLDDEAPPLWAGELDQVLLRGARLIREVAFFHRASRTLILVDLLENFTDATPNVSWVLKMWFRPLRMWNAPAPAPEYWFFGWRDRAVARACLERILAWDFERVVIAHGDLITADARAVVEEAWRRVLRP